jgi:hypothetical protein
MSLFGLILLSVLITGVLTTGATEAAISFAHRDATRDLYAAEGGIEAFIAAQNVALQPMTGFTFTPPGTNQIPVRITVEELARMQATEGLQPARHTHFSVAARPVGGGRGLVAMIRVRQSQLDPLDTNLNAALTLGGDATVTGQAMVSDGSDSQLCHPDSAADHAIVHADGTTVNAPANRLEGEKTESELSRQELIASVLGNVSLRDLAWTADIKFGQYFNEEPIAPDAHGGVFSGNSAQDGRYDWSCPKDMIEGAHSSIRRCDSMADPDHFPVIAIDAENRTVLLDNFHAQGMLIVINGTLHLAGRFQFKGIILAERNVILSGGGNTNPLSIEGAIVSAGEVIVDDEDPELLEDSEASGRGLVRFNRCAIHQVQNAFNDRGVDGWGAPQVQGSTFNWFEVVR